MIRIEHNLEKVKKVLKRVAEEKIPKAAVSVMNQCSYLARQKLVEELPAKFKINKDWVRRQTTYRKVEESDWPKLKARVGTKFKAMHYQEHGGERVGKKWPFIGVPMTVNDESTQSLIKGNPRNLLKKPGYNVVSYKGKQFLIFRKRQRKKKKLKNKVESVQVVQEAPREKTKFLYVFKEKVTNKPRWNLEKTVNKIFQSNYIEKMKKKLLGPSGV